MYRQEQEARGNTHGTSRTWVVAYRQPPGRWVSKSFGFGINGGPVFAWLAACGLVRDLECRFPDAFVPRVPRPSAAHLAEQFAVEMPA